MALSDKKIDAVTLLQWGEMKGHPLAAHRAYARAIEAEVRGQDEALIQQMHGALVSLAQWMVAEVEHFDGATPDAWIIDGVNAALAASRARLESRP